MKSKVCPKCGTTDCLNIKQYQSHLTIAGPGMIGIKSKYIIQSCVARQQLNALKKLNIS